MRRMKVRSIVINQPDSPGEHNRSFESRFYRFYSAINGDHGGGPGSRGLGFTKITWNILLTVVKDEYKNAKAKVTVDMADIHQKKESCQHHYIACDVLCRTRQAES